MIEILFCFLTEYYWRGLARELIGVYEPLLILLIYVLCGKMAGLLKALEEPYEATD